METGQLGDYGGRPGSTLKGSGIGRGSEDRGHMNRGEKGWVGKDGAPWPPRRASLLRSLCSLGGSALPRVIVLFLSISCPAGPLCPGAAMPPPSSSPPRRTRPWGRSSSTRWILAASTTSTKRSSACFPRCCFGQGSLGGHGVTPWGLLWPCLCGMAITLLFPYTQWSWAWLASLLDSVDSPLGFLGVLST